MNTPVLIAGGGPVGLMLACELGLAGVETIVLERLAEPSGRSRGMAINGAVVELLNQRGLMEALRADGFEFPLAHFAHIRTDPTRLGRRRAVNFAVPHSLVELRLEERAGKLGVDVRRGAELVGLVQHEDGVEAQVSVDGVVQSITGSYLVGCDGAASRVRDLAGIGFPGVDAPFHGMLGDLAVEAGNPLFERLGVNQYETGICTVAPAGPTTLRVVTGEFDAEPADAQAPVSLDELRAAFERITGGLLEGTPLWLDRWTNSTRQAERYRAGRVFLAGDAAHVHFPLGGQALSTGVEDAVNLGWKLAAEIRGWAPAGLLDTYHEERHPVGARACLTTRAQTALMHPMAQISPLRDILTELVRFDEVNTYLVEMVGGLDVRYPPAGSEESELVGTRLSDIPLNTAHGATSVGRLLETGRGLFLDLTAGSTPRAAGSGWAARVDTAAADPTPEIDAAAVLLRPDGRVAWAAPAGTEADDASLQAALRTWFGGPTGQA